MKKLIALLVCASLVLTMAFTAFAAETKTQEEKGNFSEALGEAGISISEGLESILSGLGTIADSLLESGVLDEIKDSVGNFINSLPEAAKNAEEGLGDIMDAIFNGSEETQEAFGDMVDDISGAIEDAQEDGTLEFNWDDLLEALGESAGESAGDSAGESAGEPAEDAEDVVDTEDAQEPADPEQSDLLESFSNARRVLGGWKVNAEFESSLTEEEQEIFESAAGSLLGVSYEPVAVLATQVVSGTNYAFLATGTPVTLNAAPSWFVVTVYQNLQGETEIRNIEEIELNDIEESEDDDDDDAMTGAWHTVVPETEVSLPEEAQEAFDAAMEGWTGVNYVPAVLLGTQIVAGTNYKVLCFGTTVTANPVTSVYAVDVYKNLQGESQITRIVELELLDYID